MQTASTAHIINSNCILICHLEVKLRTCKVCIIVICNGSTLFYAQQLHYNGYDVVILMHKSNTQRDSWHKYGTCGAGEKFLSDFPLVNNLWEQHIRKFYKGKYIDS